MSRSERYISPSDEQLEQWRKAADAAKRFDQQREELTRTALKKLRKAELIEVVLRVAREEKASEWMLEQQVTLDKPLDLLAHDIEVAINIATKVDQLRLNYNFDYDWRAYDAVRRGLSRLIENDGLEHAKAVAVKLMQKGSYQIECSDEGLMQEDIESCLQPVIAAVAESGGDRDWALKMLQHDRMGGICGQEFTELVERIREN